jgi:hypothetical protein
MSRMRRGVKRIRRRRRTAVLRCCDEHRMECEMVIDEAIAALSTDAPPSTHLVNPMKSHAALVTSPEGDAFTPFMQDHARTVTRKTPRPMSVGSRKPKKVVMSEDVRHCAKFP